jgi:adenosylcobinamide-phosphate synthase
VSRDTTQLDAATVRESAIETLAENLSDSVIAPLFWFAVAGLPGAAVYRFANTADAMWGYPGWRPGRPRRHWQWAGKWAARADDVLNWIPARITAMAGAAGRRPVLDRFEARCSRDAVAQWRLAHGRHGAGAGVQLSKPGVYRLNPQGRAPQAADLKLSVKLASKVIVAGPACVGSYDFDVWRGRLLANV